jgi:hypothetical protein
MAMQNSRLTHRDVIDAFPSPAAGAEKGVTIAHIFSPWRQFPIKNIEDEPSRAGAAGLRAPARQTLCCTASNHRLSAARFPAACCRPRQQRKQAGPASAAHEPRMDAGNQTLILHWLRHTIFYPKFDQYARNKIT